METSLWRHQVEALDKLRGSARQGRRRIVLQAPPGSGKTEIGIEVVKGARAKGNAVAFTVPMLNLVEQTVARFEKRGIPADDVGVMQARHEKTDEAAPVQVVSVQTLSRRAFPFANVVLVDEAHIQHAVIRRWMDAAPDALFIGLSATPWSRGMADYWQDLQVVSTINEMIGEGILSPYRTFIPKEKPNLAGVKTIAGDYAEGELSGRMSEKRIVADVPRTWLEKGEGRPTLVFAVDRAHAAILTDEFESVGVRAKYVDANTEMDERADYMRGLESGETQVIVSIGTMTTGVDIPCVSCISFARPTKSPILFVQSIARGLRAYPGKADCIVLDHSTTTVRLGLVGDIHFDSLLPGKVDKEKVSREIQRPLPRECASCHFLVPAGEPRCPNCGAIARRPTTARSEDGELVELTRDAIDLLTPAQRRANKKLGPADKARFFAELKGYAADRGFAPGWAAHRYQDRFGVWPNRYSHVAAVWPPSLETAAWIRGQAANRAIARSFGGNRNAR